MINKLFIVCPFSNLEYLLKKQFGHDSFFISAPAGLVPFTDKIFLESLKSIISANAIGQVCVVADIANPLILSVIHEDYTEKIPLLNPVTQLKEEFWMERLAGLTSQQQALKLAELLIEQSIEFLQSFLVSKNPKEAHFLAVRGFVLSKESGFIKESKKMNRYKLAYGL